MQQKCKRLPSIVASHKSNPSSMPQGVVDSYFHMGGGNRCGGYTLLGIATTDAG